MGINMRKNRKRRRLKQATNDYFTNLTSKTWKRLVDRFTIQISLLHTVKNHVHDRQYQSVEMHSGQGQISQIITVLNVLVF
jgi:crotonobetainyl-CoA:carnitine CoA-transferase CaiB-like acyl-CoA transferase